MSSSRPVAGRRPRPVFEGPTYMAPNYHSRIWGRLIFLLFIVLLVGLIGGGGGLYWALHRAQGDSSQPVHFQVSSGDTVTSVANRLQNLHLIDSALLFRLDARLQNLGGRLKVGDYGFRKNMSIDQMVGALTQYRQRYISITVREGLRSEQIADILTRSGLNGKAFLAEVRHPNVKALGSDPVVAAVLKQKPAGASLEGFLFPDTYRVVPHSSAHQFVLQMLHTFGMRVTPSMRAAYQHQRRSLYDVLKLASIVEREARVPSERPLIAGVYMNRLRSAPRILDADPTVQYTVGHAGNWWPVLRDEAARVNSQNPFNSYTHAGLPPTPIANPGLASILASIYPKKTQYEYFVAIRGGHGKHVFAVTLDQQNANIAKYG